MPYRKRPCAECPWRRDTPPGQFSAERYEATAATSGTPGNEAPLGAPLFACHKSKDGADVVCAGWLAAVGIESIPVRLLVSFGELPASVLRPGEGWPPLFGSHDEMAETQGRPS